ncbi:dienelactone hydrolase [Paenibacillus darwinianus]|uniref:7,8-dihydroneopterin aldolase n=1 Tax=Paenibacillus darwinianus TaxID=1380763 RepID=A0A9W5S0N5_9BACL|nr:dihydroneopterin aldolase [Paenibacillus darwinianus]EXX86748.1 dienelactone hydrolase [Paenibacillus darwinianus]EXX87614.1 dienelactone hydrolase [Paenibacillus darwinianus]EXX87650.1 dienelactone hydrolase [Paenibacillus darwinianus]
MDKMTLRGMQFFGYHGVVPEENRLGQRFGLELELHLDLHQAEKSDDLSQTVNYAEVYALVKAAVEGPPSKLIEAVAGRVASAVLDTYTIINEVTVRLTKPHPPFDIHFDGVTVELRRKRDADGRVVPV